MIIDPEFKALIPPLSAEEYAGLEASILAEGCRDALVVWGDILVDGHNRYEICQKYGIVFETVHRSFNERADAELWIITNQLSRRNLSAYERIRLGLRSSDIIAARAKAKEYERKTTFQKSEKSNMDGINTTKEVAKIAGVSHDTVAKVKVIEAKATPEVKALLFSGKASINEVYKGIKSEEKKEERKAEIEEVKKKIGAEEITMPSGKFDVIVIDPPWNYGRTYDPNTSRIANPYPEMTQDELLCLDLPSKDDCVIFLWTTHAFVWDAKKLLDAWGFEYKAMIVWDKEKMGMGAWFRMQCEFCLVGIKGKPVFNNTTYRDIIREPRREHSRKPDCFYEMVESITVGKRVDWFSRESRNGWITYGAENGKMG